MLKKFAKIWFGYVLGSCVLYVHSETMLAMAKVDKAHRDGNGDAKLCLRPIIAEAFDNYKDAVKTILDE